MENRQIQTKKIALNYGLLLGFASILLHVILYVMGKHLEQDLKVFFYIFNYNYCFDSNGYKKI